MPNRRQSIRHTAAFGCTADNQRHPAFAGAATAAGNAAPDGYADTLEARAGLSCWSCCARSALGVAPNRRR
jgi:hypothetical protein